MSEMLSCYNVRPSIDSDRKDTFLGYEFIRSLNDS